LLGCSRRYLTHRAALSDDGRSVKGIDFFAPGGHSLPKALENLSIFNNSGTA
jgi:hypothetical protein